MSSDLRYHIASLAAVFFALGIGILIGTAFVGAPLVSRQTALIKRLEGNVGALRRETRESERNEDALRILAPRVVRDTLAGRRVLVVQCGAYPEASARAEDAAQAAGATDVVQIALPASAWARIGEAAATSADQTESVEAEARRLAPLLLSGADDALETYRRDGLLTGDALEGKPTRLVVLVGGGLASGQASGGANAASPENNERAAAAYENLATRLDATLAGEAAKNAGTIVVGVETTGAEASAMRMYQQADIATVDCIDRAAGQIALPFALRGEKANYGLKSTADANRVLPASLETETLPVALPIAAPPPAAPKPSPSPLRAAAPARAKLPSPPLRTLPQGAAPR